MATKFIYSFFILFIIISSSFIALCSTQVHFDADVTRKQRLNHVESFNQSTKKSIYNTFMFPGLSSDPLVKTLGHHAGYFPIKNSHNARMFYFFFESRGSKSDPVVLWLSDGPTSGSEMSIFYENGPFHINDDLTLKWNPFGWDKVSNLLYVDQLVGTGFSYSLDERDLRDSAYEISNDLYDFLQAFFQDNPNFAKNDFYITGRSYAGHFIPVLASLIYKGNKDIEGIHINIKGIAIGNGFTNPKYKYQSYPDYTLNNLLLSKSYYREFKKITNECVTLIEKCQTNDDVCHYASDKCYDVYHNKLHVGRVNHYDIRKIRMGAFSYNFSKIEKFFNLDSVKKTLDIENVDFIMHNKTVAAALYDDEVINYAKIIPLLLENGIKVLIYAGEYDLINNWLGNFRWVNAIKWSSQNQYLKTKLSPFKLDGKKVGMVKSCGLLTFVKVYNAGQLVSMDQPNVSLEMLKQLMN